MGNCLVAQSGGPTAVINASLAGVVRANQLNPLYDHVSEACTASKAFWTASSTTSPTSARAS